jgi:hypothetical protein
MESLPFVPIPLSPLLASRMAVPEQQKNPEIVPATRRIFVTDSRFEQFPEGWPLPVKSLAPEWYRHVDREDDSTSHCCPDIPVGPIQIGDLAAREM